MNKLDSVWSQLKASQPFYSGKSKKTKNKALKIITQIKKILGHEEGTPNKNSKEEPGNESKEESEKQEGGNKEQVEALNKIKNFFKDEYTIRRTEFVGPVVGEELKEAGITAVLLSLFLILIYIWFRFEWQFSIAAIFALSHDVLTTIGLFSLLNLEFNLAIVAALLTTAGYSINDTVVVFDRVRENLRRYKSQQNIVIYNRSINETLSRTVITSLTTLLALFVIYFFGGAVLKDFALAMIWGVVIGTYSSIFIAVSSLTFFKIYKGSEDKDKSKSVLEHEL